MNRRVFLSSPLALAAPAAGKRSLLLNEDANHFFSSRAGQTLTADAVREFVDQYAGTQVSDLLFNVNAMRAGFRSKTRTSFFDGYDPNGGDRQPMFRSVSAAEAAAARAWVHQAWTLDRMGIDPYAEWLRRARKHGIRAWVSIRMNDLHNVEDEKHYLHSEFWKQHPELRRVPYRGEQRDKALDYLQAAVREHNFSFIEEVARRYKFDGLELDWMRFGFHLAPGREEAGAAVLTEFHRRVRRLLGPSKPIAVRVPSRPETARRLGLDAVRWAREGLVDVVTVTNFWRTVDTDMPIRIWRELLPSQVQVHAGLELGLNSFPGSVAVGTRPFQTNSLETVRGAAAAYMGQGADGIYLFNYMDRQTAMDDNSTYGELLRETGNPEAMSGKARRHVVTYQDTWAPGEKSAYKLPIDAVPGRWIAVRQPVSPDSAKYRASVRIGVSGGDASQWMVRVNGRPASFVRKEEGVKPGPNTPLFRFATPLAEGEAVVDMQASTGGRVEWLEILLEP